jgi:hypothetical protein
MRKRILCELVCTVMVAAAAPAVGKYELVTKITVPGTGGWDYVTVDESARRVYVSHSTQVDVLDADSYAFVGTIPNTPGVHGVAVAPEFGRGYVRWERLKLGKNRTQLFMKRSRNEFM